VIERTGTLLSSQASIHFSAEFDSDEIDEIL
jgi:hypothetical protein